MSDWSCWQGRSISVYLEDMKERFKAWRNRPKKVETPLESLSDKELKIVEIRLKQKENKKLNIIAAFLGFLVIANVVIWKVILLLIRLKVIGS